MKYPQAVDGGLTIAICTPSRAVVRSQQKALIKAKKQLLKHNLAILPSPYFKSATYFESTIPQNRAEELNNAFKNKNAQAIMATRGGELMLETLPLINFNAITKNIKWYLGYSDNTSLTFTLPTTCDIATIYGYNFKDFGKKTCPSIEDHINVLTNNKTNFTSYKTNKKTKKSEWEIVNYSASQVVLNGRMLGGCLDILVNICGTKYDKVKAFNKKYPEGIIWFLETYDINSAEVTRALWQLKNAGWFEGAKGFLFGKPFNNKNYLGLSFKESVIRTLAPLGLPIIFNCQFGHVPPTIPIIVGATAEISIQNNTATINYILN